MNKKKQYVLKNVCTCSKVNTGNIGSISAALVTGEDAMPGRWVKAVWNGITKGDDSSTPEKKIK